MAKVGRPRRFRREAAEKKAVGLLEIKSRARKFPLYYYTPIPKIAPFHKARARVRILSGANRSGKSESNIAEALAYAIGYRPWVMRECGIPAPKEPWVRPDGDLPRDAICFNCEGVRVPVPNRTFIVTGLSLRKGIQETLHPKIQKFAGNMIEKERVLQGICAWIRLKNKSEIFFGSAEQGNLAFEATNYTFTAIDEPVPRRVYTGIARGSVDQAAPIVMTFTPLGQWATWIFKDLYSRSFSGSKHVEAFSLSIFDNPYLPKDAVENFSNDPALTEMEREARLYGKFTHLADRIYTNFSDAHHIIPQGYVPRDWYMGMVVDPHTVRPWFIAYFAISPSGDIHFFKEWPPGDFTKIRRDHRSVEQYAMLIRQLDGDLPIQIRLMDPNYGPRNDTLRGVVVPSIQSDMSRFGLFFNCKINDDLGYGEHQVRSLLHFDSARPLDSLNKPRLFFMEGCRNVIASMQFYTAKPRYNMEGEIEDLKREEQFKDGADVVRYVCVSQIAPAAAENAWEQIYGQGENDDVGLGISGYGEGSYQGGYL